MYVYHERNTTNSKTLGRTVGKKSPPYHISLSELNSGTYSVSIAKSEVHHLNIHLAYNYITSDATWRHFQLCEKCMRMPSRQGINMTSRSQQLLV